MSELVKVSYKSGDEYSEGHWDIDDGRPQGMENHAWLNFGNNFTLGFDFLAPQTPASARVYEPLSREEADGKPQFVGPDQIVLSSLFGESIEPLDQEPEDDLEVTLPLRRPNMALGRTLGQLAVIDRMRHDRQVTLVITDEDRQRATEMFGPNSRWLKDREKQQRAKQKHYRQQPMPSEEALAEQEEALLQELAKELWMIDFSNWAESRRSKRIAVGEA